ACEHEFDEFQSITAKPLKKCPQCGKTKLRRKIGAGAGIIFKGSGFYETDYRSESYKKSAKAEKEAASPKSDGGDKKSSDGAAKSESKPAKTETKAKKTDTKPAAKS